MTRFLYIADTHLGASPMGHQQQPGYPEKLPELLAALVAYAQEIGGIDFMLHGGDMVDSPTPADIELARQAFDLPFPVYLCLGNHDLAGSDALARWLNLAPQFFRNGAPEYTLAFDDCRVHVAPNHWEERPYVWDQVLDPRFDEHQMDYLRNALAAAQDVPHLLATHSPVWGLPESQTGMDTPYHASPLASSECLLGLARSYPRLHCIMGAHSHANMHIDDGFTHYITVSALVETPFEAKLFEVTPETVRRQTVSLIDRVTWHADYNASRAFAQGRPCDRAWADRIQNERTND